MKLSASRLPSLILGGISLLPLLAPAQSKPDANSPKPSTVTADYPKDRTGVLIDSSGWTEVPQAFPSKTHVKHGIAASLTYGAVPAVVVAEYEGLHAPVQLEPGRPVLCICHLISLPGAPVVVRLHPKKNSRELDGGRLPVLGAKVSEATKSDLVDVDMSQPENTVWLVRPREALPSGEYALMLGTQNMSIFAFTISNPANASPAPVPDKH
jgi:hypothetical protein